MLNAGDDDDLSQQVRTPHYAALFQDVGVSLESPVQFPDMYIYRAFTKYRSENVSSTSN
ncbi:hypothetical protein J6590_048727 [Homalodisca vitripennis]|nr:hypothetical protein J6590_048727 [Homalodisca vitripennis]